MTRRGTANQESHSPSYVARGMSCFDQFGPAAVIDGMMRQSAPCAANKAIRHFQARSLDAERIACALLPKGGASMLGKTLRRRIKHGRLTIIRPDGHTEQFGELTAAKPRPDVAVRLKGALTSLKLSLHPDLYFGELYVDGALIMERGTLWDLLELLGRNHLEQRSVPGNSVIGPLQAFLGWMRRGDSRRAATRHVAHHYDLPHEHYRRFLDADLQYSCAYFADPNFSLEQAQEA